MGKRGLIAFACGVTLPLLVLMPLLEDDAENHEHGEAPSDTSLVVS